MFSAFKKISALSLVAAIFPFLMLPFLTKYLSQDDYGVLVLFDSFTSLIVPLIHFSIAGLIVEFYKLNEKDFKSYLYNSILLSIPVLIVLQVLVIFTSEFVEERYQIERGVYLWLPTIVFSNFFIQIYLLLKLCQNKHYQYGIFILAPPFLVSVLTLIFIWLELLTWQARAYSMLIIYSIFSFIALYYLWLKEFKGYQLSLNKNLVLLNLRFTLPLLPHTCAASLYFVSDRFFIAEYVNNTGVAIYSAGLQFSMIMGVVQNAFSKAWNPMILSVLKNNTETILITERQQKTIFRLVSYALLALTLIYFCLAIFIYLIVPYLLPLEYIEARYVGIYLATGFYFLGFYKTLSPVLWHFKKSKFISQITITVLLINICLNYYLVPKIGVDGAVLSTVLSMFFQFIFTALYVVKIWFQHKKLELNA